MAIFRLIGVILIGSGLLAACSGAAPSPIVPGANAGAPQIQSQSRAIPQKPHTGRVLYIGDIDGQPGLGQIHVYTANMKDPQQLRMITSGAGRPFGMWVDGKNVLYVANYPNKLPGSVTEFKPNASGPFFEITNFKGDPESVAVDDQQNVYVNESVQDEGFVQVYAPGSGTAQRTIDTGIGGYAFESGGMGFDRQGNLIVAEQAKLKLQIVKIARGSSTVTPVNLDLDGHNITGPGMGIDKAGNIYVASSGAATVSVFAPGQTEPSRVILNVRLTGIWS